MIKYNLNTINDWNFGDDNIIKVYRHNAVCYYKITGGGDVPTAQTPCFAVVDDITQYSETEFEDVYDKATEKWYKLNNLNQYEEYGIYGSGRTITYYEGKLTIDGDYEYQYSGGSWINVGEISGSTSQIVWFDPPSSGDNAKFDIGHYWGENYKMIFTAYLQGSYSSDIGSFWIDNNKSPIEYHFYSNGYYYDMHNPTSTSSPSVDTRDYSYRIMRNNSLRNYENGQVMDITLTYGSVKIELVDSGTVIENTGSTRTGFNWYNGLYLPSIQLNSSSQKCHLSRIQVYNASNVLVNDITFVRNNGVTGSQEISMYDSVLNVTYNNTNSNTPTYHIVEEGGGYEYPLEYVVREDPPNNLTFSSMTEAEAYECPWVGMKATIDGDKYVFSGDSQSGYEWVEKTSKDSDFVIGDFTEFVSSSTEVTEGYYIIYNYNYDSSYADKNYLFSWNSGKTLSEHYTLGNMNHTDLDFSVPILSSEIIDDAVWELKSDGNGNFYIRNVGKNLYWYYLGNSAEYGVPLTDNANNAIPVNIQNWENCLAFVEKYNSSNYPINRLYNSPYRYGWYGSLVTDGNNQYYMRKYVP